MILGFAAVILLSLGLVLAARRGGTRDARSFFAASGQFGAALVFVLAVGETYSVASMLGYPGGVFLHGDGFSAWFFGYILLTAPVMFFVGPAIARAGSLYHAVTIADFFGRHFASRTLERVVAVAAIVALLPVGTMQFIGLRIVLTTLAPGASTIVSAGCAGLLAFGYVAIAGLRGSAFVAILKDLLMIGSILLVSIVAIAGWDHGLVPATADRSAVLSGHDLRFAVSTILVQAVGYALLPQSWTFLFAARNGTAIRRAQAAAPLYMVMFPLLACIATYALQHGLHPATPDQVFLVTAATLLPGWTFGVVLAGVLLAGLVLLAAVCLAIGSLITRNLLTGLSGSAQQGWAKAITAAYLAASIAFAEQPGQLMATLNNIIYFGIVQLLPGFIAAMVLRRVPAAAIVGGIVAGDLCASVVFFSGLDVGGINPGLIALLANAAVVAAVTFARPRDDAPSVMDQLAASEIEVRRTAPAS
jgi:solute:Na+ symporter, SSS family